MEITWRTVEGTQEEQPAAIDKLASAVYVYIRKNIMRKTKKTESGNVKVWEYLEARLTKDEFVEYMHEIGSPTYQALEAQRAELDAANSTILMQQMEIQATQAAQDEILSLLLLGGAGGTEPLPGIDSPLLDIPVPDIDLA